MTHTVSLLWAFREFATHTVSLLWAIREITRWAHHAVVAVSSLWSHWITSPHISTSWDPGVPLLLHSEETKIIITIGVYVEQWWINFELNNYIIDNGWNIFTSGRNSGKFANTHLAKMLERICDNKCHSETNFFTGICVQSNLLKQPPVLNSHLY